MTTPSIKNDIAPQDRTDFDMAPDQGAAIYANRRADGSLDTNVAWSGCFSTEERQEIASKLVKMVEHAEDLNAAADKAEANGQPELAANLRAEANEVMKQANSVKSAAEQTSTHLGKSVYEIEMQTQVLIDKFDPSAGENLLALVEGGESTSEYNEVCDSSDGASADEYNVSDDELLRKMEADPEAFYRGLGDLSSEDRNAIMMRLNQIIQTNNQIFSAISNMQKAQHDTQKAVLANLRV